MTREIALHCMKSASELERELCEECPIYGQTGCDHCFEDALQYVIGMLEQEPTTKNDLGVDCISRESVLDLIADYDLSMGQVVRGIHALPSVTPQEPFINKPCVSSGVCKHDKQKVLDKIREQMKDYLRGVEITLEVLVENDPLRPKMEGAKDTLEECLELIDKAETEDT